MTLRNMEYLCEAINRLIEIRALLGELVAFECKITISYFFDKLQVAIILINHAQELGKFIVIPKQP